LGALEFALASPREIAIIGHLDDTSTQEMLQSVLVPYRPNQVVAVATQHDSQGHPELVADRPAVDEKTTAYVCQRFACKQPVTSVAELEELL
jgi:uncharacterized protein YyaL (SSP411 family)